MKMQKKHWIGIGIAAGIIVVDLIFLLKEKVFWFILGIAVVIGALPFVISLIIESKKERQKEQMFLEFSRNLVESVRAGTPISKAILNVKEKNYESLSPHIKKLANQISLGIPVKKAFEVFSRDVDNELVSRAINLIGQAENAGGDIEDILESVAKSVAETEKLKKERAAAISSLVVQGYIIFLVFIAIMLVMEFKILPMTAGISDVGLGGGITTDFTSIEETETTGGVDAGEIGRPFLYLLIIQGLFAGLVIGKLSEGSLKAGIKHSFILVIVSILISTGAEIFL